MTNDPDARTLYDDFTRHWRVTQFLYKEAALLDARKMWEWLELFTDDVDYWMPIRRTVAFGEDERAFTRRRLEHSYFDEDKSSLEMRIRKLETGYSWSEDPPSRTRHIVTNAQVTADGDAGDVEVDCNFIVYRSRLGNEEALWVGRRVDRLRADGSSWKISQRHIFLDQSLLSAKNLSNFF